ncbi:CopD family protein [Actinokineospora bangkokensis]|uniref:Copper resistance protein D domain-containing protein n=1 Tax=Actinokineospora bangkokensis TaxID=1193682 RepID=A0A1Q9LC87_9PSEU|nr:CopD family protein [Actinokineospora bangkokensis]OLR89640.1 hypothetical protein BJP25_04765 [Actinokineospora bangkokensis]
MGVGSVDGVIGTDPGERAPGRAAALGSIALLGLVGLVVAAGIAVALTAGGAAPAVPGLPDPGIAVRAGLPAVRVATEVVAVLTVGALLAAAVLVPDAHDRRVAATWAGRGAALWTVLALAMVVLTLADSTGMTLRQVADARRVVDGVGTFEAATAWLAMAAAAALIALWQRFGVAPIALLALSVVAIAPAALTGHSSAGVDHDWAADSLMAHIAAAAVWVGGLLAVLVVACARRPYAVAAIELYSAIALGCWLVVVGTGVVNAFLRVQPGDLLSTRYGALLLVKTGAVLLLGGLGYLHRARTIPRLAVGRRAPFLRLGAVEVLLMLLTVGVAVGLARSPGPRAEAAPATMAEGMLGYDLPVRPSVGRVLLDWRPDLVFSTLAVGLAVWYLVKVRDRAWPSGRVTCWLVGCLVLLVATSSGLGKFEPAVLSAHVLVQVLVGFAAAALLARGRPLELAAVQVRGWPRAWVVALVYALPLVLLYGVGLYADVAGQHWARQLLLAWSLAAGFALFSQPRPRRGPVLFVAGVYLGCGVALLTRDDVLGHEFVHHAGLAWRHDGSTIQTAAGVVAVIAAVAVAVYAGSVGEEREAELP